MSNKPDRAAKRMNIVEKNSMLNVPSKNLTRGGGIEDGFSGSPVIRDESYYLNKLLEKPNPRIKSSERHSQRSTSGTKSGKKKKHGASQTAYQDSDTRNSIT